MIANVDQFVDVDARRISHGGYARYRFRISGPLCPLRSEQGEVYQSTRSDPCQPKKHPGVSRWPSRGTGRSLRFRLFVCRLRNPDFIGLLRLQSDAILDSGRVACHPAGDRHRRTFEALNSRGGRKFPVEDHAKALDRVGRRRAGESLASGSSRKTPNLRSINPSTAKVAFRKLRRWFSGSRLCSKTLRTRGSEFKYLPSAEICSERSAAGYSARVAVISTMSAPVACSVMTTETSGPVSQTARKGFPLARPRFRRVRPRGARRRFASGRAYLLEVCDNSMRTHKERATSCRYVQHTETSVLWRRMG
ncbi:MAG: hypothetical protein UZ18_ATM001000926 [Armatimonadetes bacterium OLB18]|nr:MAG: hypothetical protein UZ18_ATM001000926 [Armatimonadetes bacterium OLB18]